MKVSIQKSTYFDIVRLITASLRQEGFAWIRTYSEKRADGRYRTKLYCICGVQLENGSWDKGSEQATKIVKHIKEMCRRLNLPIVDPYWDATSDMHPYVSVMFQSEVPIEG